MILTEDEAKMKWCPMSRFAAEEGGMSYNRGTEGDGLSKFTRCVASRCLAWRWTERGVISRGYCGFGGKP